MEEMNTEKLSYEQLENVAAELQKRCATLLGELQNANMFNMFKRLDYLFKVVENNTRFPVEFSKQCVDEIITLMTPPTEEKTEEA